VSLLTSCGPQKEVRAAVRERVAAVENGLGEGGALAAPMDSPWKKTTQLTELSEGSSGQPRHSLEKKKMLSQEEILFLRMF
jgi:hypothetical protein